MFVFFNLFGKLMYSDSTVEILEEALDLFSFLINLFLPQQKNTFLKTPEVKLGKQNTFKTD